MTRTFTKTDSNPDNLYNLERWVSDDGLYYIELNQVMFGARVHVCRFDDAVTRYTEYCAGSDFNWQQYTLFVVIRIMSQAPNEVDFNYFPDYLHRPMYRDPKCWAALCELAGLPVLVVEDKTVDELLEEYPL